MLPPRKPPPPDHPGCFLHKGRIVWAIYYDLVDGRAVIVWLDRDSNVLECAQHRDPSKRIVTAKPGDEIVFNRERAKVAAVKVFRESSPMTLEDMEWWNAGPA